MHPSEQIVSLTTDAHSRERHLARGRSQLELLRSELERSGHFVRELDAALSCELKHRDVVTGTAFFVPASVVFALDRYPIPETEHGNPVQPEHFEYEFRRFQEAVVGPSFFEAKRTQLEFYLFIVGSESYLDEVDSLRIGQAEGDTSYARKFVVTPDQALSLLRNPFPFREEQAARPTFDAVQELSSLRDDAAAVTDVLSLSSLDVEGVDAAHLTAASTRKLRARVDRAVMRIAGTGYRVFWNSDGIRIGRQGDASGFPLQYVSSGERIVFMFALHLAKLADTANETTRLGVYGVLNQLSLVWYLGAIDVLREFSVATGASVRLQTPKHDRAVLARNKFSKVSTVEITAKSVFS